MKALVLSGGGAYGAYEAGVVSSLLQRESYDLLCGVSIGAINAALVAAGDENALWRFWHRELPAKALELFPHIPRLRRLLEHVVSIGQGGTFADAMRVARAAAEFPFLRNLANVHKTGLPAVAKALDEMVDFSTLRTPLLLGSTNTTRAAVAVFYAYPGGGQPPALGRAAIVEYEQLTAENFVHALLASSAMPGLFSPIALTFDGKTSLYADGCMVHASPLGVALDNGATDVTIVFVDPEFEPQATGAGGLPAVAHTLATLWQQRILDYEMQLAQANNEIARLRGRTAKAPVSIRYVRPEKPLDLDMLAFDDAAALARVFAQGAADGAVDPRFKLREHAGEREGWFGSLRRFLRLTADA